MTKAEKNARQVQIRECFPQPLKEKLDEGGEGKGNAFGDRDLICFSSRRPRMAYGASYLKGTRFFDRRSMRLPALSSFRPLAYWDSSLRALPALSNKTGSARESAGNNRKEGVHVAAAPAPFLVNGAQQVRHLLQKRESTSDNHASTRQRVEWPRADLFGYIIQVESRVTGTAV